MSRVPDGVAEYSVWGAEAADVAPAPVPGCVSIRENDDGTYAITAVQHVPEKEAIVDNGRTFDGDQSCTVKVSYAASGAAPDRRSHSADSGEYCVLARWGHAEGGKGRELPASPRPWKRDDGRERVGQHGPTTENHIPLHKTTGAGELQADSPAVNAWGSRAIRRRVSFPIAAPAAPSRIELDAGLFSDNRHAASLRLMTRRVQS